MLGNARPRVSLVLTVKNEAATLPALLASIADQRVPPDEVVIVDGGSTDDTLAILERWRDRLPLVIDVFPGASISQGRNRALALARGDIVAVTDGGVVLAPDWLERLVAPFTAPPAEQPDVVAGVFRPAPQTLFEHALAAVTLPDPEEMRAEGFLPSSRSVAYRRSWFLAGVRYPEWLDYCEDVVFDLRLKRAGARFQLARDAVVAYRPRTSLSAFWWQYWHYARGDGKAGLFTLRHLIRYAVYGSVGPVLVWGRHPVVRLAVFLAALSYLRRPWQRLWRRRAALRPTERVFAALLVPVLRAVGDMAKMAGYPVGVWWRIRRYGLRRTWRTIPEIAPGGQCLPDATVQRSTTPRAGEARPAGP